MGEKPDGSWQGEGTEVSLSLTPEQNTAVKEFHEAGVARRPAYDAMMRGVVAANAGLGMVLVGDTGEGEIEHSLKGLNSLRRKVASQLPDYEGDIQAVLADVKDLHRYSSATEPANYTAAAEGAVNHLNGENAEFIKFNHSWRNPVYKGGNAVVKPAIQVDATDPEVRAFQKDSIVQDAAKTIAAREDPTDLGAPSPAVTVELQARGFDVPCEFQMHTPGNLKVKDKLHLPYELQRSGMLEKKFGADAQAYKQATDYVMASMYQGRDDVMPANLDRLDALTRSMKVGKVLDGPASVPAPKPEALAQVNRILFAMEAIQNQQPLQRRNSNQSLYERAAEAAQLPAISRTNSAPGEIPVHTAPAVSPTRHTPAPAPAR
ncbi:hypothetical protein [Streptomyces sp. NPDC051642]|uniref:hypothetical protein n=1 Tax=unclassified Streptomyces TaxID=2593676 RepID=UPI00343FA7EB